MATHKPSDSGNREPSTTPQQVPGDRAGNAGPRPNPSPANGQKPVTTPVQMPDGGSGGNSLNDQ